MQTVLPIRLTAGNTLFQKTPTRTPIKGNPRFRRGISVVVNLFRRIPRWGQTNLVVVVLLQRGGRQ